MSATIEMSREELKRRRQKLLADLHTDYPDLRRRADAYVLRDDERSAYEAIRSIDYLLGE